MIPFGPRCPEPRRAVLLALLTACAAGCSGPQVHRLGNGDGAAAYAISAGSTGEVHREARRLCPAGHVVLRAGGKATVPAGDDDSMAQAAIATGQWLAGLPGNVAQATIVCTG